MDAIDVKIHRNVIGEWSFIKKLYSRYKIYADIWQMFVSLLGKTRTLGSVIGRSLKLKDSIHKLSNQNLTQESFPLITCSKSTNVLGDCSQCATDSKFYTFFCWNILHTHLVFSLIIKIYIFLPFYRFVKKKTGLYNFHVLENT